MSAAKYPRRAVAFGPPFDDGTVPEPKPRRRMKQASPSNGAWPPTSEAMPHRPTSRTPDDTAQDNGARALAERLNEFPNMPFGVLAADWAGAILANGAAFLPDTAELDRLTKERDEAQMEYEDCWHEGDRLRAELDRLRRIEAAAREELRTRDVARAIAGRHAAAGHAYTDPMPDLDGATVVATDAEAALRAALAPEGSARDGG